MDPERELGRVRKPVTRSSSPMSTTPNAGGSGATTIVAAAPCAPGARASSAERSTSISSSPFSDESGSVSWRACGREAQAATPPHRLRLRHGTISGPKPAAPLRRRPPVPEAQLTITRFTPTAASCPTWYAASGRPAIGTSGFGRPSAASPRRSAFRPRSGQLPSGRGSASSRARERQRPADALVFEPCGAHRLGIEEVPPVDDQRCRASSRAPPRTRDRGARPTR